MNVYFSVEKIVLLYALYVDKDHRRRGYSAKLFESAVEKCHKTLGVDVFVSFISSPHTLRAVRKQGFKEEFVKMYMDNLAAYNRMSEKVKLTHDRIIVAIKRFDKLQANS